MRTTTRARPGGRRLPAALCCCALLLLACGSSGPRTGTLELSFTDRAHPGHPDRPDTDAVQIVFRNAAGQRVGNPIERPLTEHVAVDGVPLDAATVELDYLRNGGFALHESRATLGWSGAHAAVTNPAYGAATPASSRWTATVDASGQAGLTVATVGQPGADGPPVTTPFTVKGVAYSPAPIGYSNAYAPALGDLFFDTFAPQDFLDFQKVWGRDVENIRASFNTVRVYSMMAIQLGPDGSVPPDPTTAQEFQHLKFLDALWNNGVDPVYVIVGIPMPDRIFIKEANDAPDPTGIKHFWDVAYTRIITQLASHPAVLGFTMFNELGGADEWGGPGPDATFYWSQVQKYSGRAKQIAPDKLVGWAFFDAPSLVTTARPLMAQYAGAVDFYGVNAFQKDEIADTLDPYLASNLGPAARPVILTEYGLPATTHGDTSTWQPWASGYGPPPPGVPATTPFPTKTNIDSMTDSPASIGAAAAAVARVIPQALAHPVSAGMTYFEWSDEWWKQNPMAVNGDGVPALATEITRWNGGLPDPGFPNGNGDEEGFGLHGVAVNGRPPDRPYTTNPNTPAGNTTPDLLTRRGALFGAVTGAYGPVR